MPWWCCWQRADQLLATRDQHGGGAGGSGRRSGCGFDCGCECGCFHAVGRGCDCEATRRAMSNVPNSLECCCPLWPNCHWAQLDGSRRCWASGHGFLVSRQCSTSGCLPCDAWEVRGPRRWRPCHPAIVWMEVGAPCPVCHRTCRPQHAEEAFSSFPVCQRTCRCRPRHAEEVISSFPAWGPQAPRVVRKAIP